ncbi:ABC transporter substrate-binding protein [Lutispora thermophila]|uniref:Substrate-binding protein n=1 Tax=Lutispora thermophila DSM 19022 TaxID=1122184 RepID=A0A1M6H9X8_9FIRM|nr:ABC transporter substrate-binding protein [Lutispora thermophila]SHJ18899.1 substrate-binding protein [Lutispora thermophila DSM 19022]
MFKKLTMVIFVLLLSIAVLTACGSKSTNVPKNENDNETQAPESAIQPEDELQAIKAELLKAADEVVVTEDEVIFKDDSRREVITIKKKPQKVAVLYGSHACLYTEAGGKVSVGIGGASAEALYEKQIGRNIMKDEGVVTIATSSSGKSWNVEAILAEKPDLIICSTAMSGYSTISKPAEAVNIPVIAITYNGVSDYLKWFKVFCNINEKPELWDSVAAKVANEIANIQLKAKKANKNPKVMALTAGKNGFSALLSNSDTGAIIKDLYGINLADISGSSATSVDINLEDIYTANPELVFIRNSATDRETAETLEKLVKDNPIWESLEAVKNGRVYILPQELFWYRPNHRYAESYKMMAEWLYPDIEF